MGVRLQRDGAAALIILEWPEIRNAISVDGAKEINRLIDEAAELPDISGLVLTGEGVFCAGANLKQVADRSASGMSEADRKTIVYGVMQSMVRKLIAFPLPTIAAIDGPAIGLGFDLALACDSRLIGEKGWCMQGWGRIGVIPGLGGEYLLRLRAPSLLWQLLESQPRIDRDLAEQWNVGEAVHDVSARERAVARINGYAEMSREALMAYVDLYRMDLRRDLDEHLLAAVHLQVKLLSQSGLQNKISAVLPQS